MKIIFENKYSMKNYIRRITIPLNGKRITAKYCDALLSKIHMLNDNDEGEHSCPEKLRIKFKNCYFEKGAMATFAEEAVFFKVIFDNCVMDNVIIPENVTYLKLRNVCITPVLTKSYENIKILTLIDTHVINTNIENRFHSKYFPNIEVLDLSCSDLNEIPVVVTGFKQLKKLFLQNNEISEIPPFIYEMKTLQYVNLERNNIDYVPCMHFGCIDIDLITNKALQALKMDVSVLPNDIVAVCDNPLSLMPTFFKGMSVHERENQYDYQRERRHGIYSVMEEPELRFSVLSEELKECIRRHL